MLDMEYIIPTLELQIAELYVIQMAAQINMPLGMEVDLGPDDIVSDGDLAPPPQKGGRAPLPNF